MRALSLLLLGFPRRFRQEYGTDLLCCVRDARASLRHDGPASVARFWVGVALNLLRAALGERLLACSEWCARRSVSVACGALLLSGAAANTLFDVLTPELSMGIGAMLLTVIAAAAAGRLLLRAPRIRR